MASCLDSSPCISQFDLPVADSSLRPKNPLCKEARSICFLTTFFPPPSECPRYELGLLPCQVEWRAFRNNSSIRDFLRVVMTHSDGALIFFLPFLQTPSLIAKLEELDRARPSSWDHQTFVRDSSLVGKSSERGVFPFMDGFEVHLPDPFSLCDFFFPFQKSPPLIEHSFLSS